ncbi:MAG: valine--tRNA ligase [Thermoplasmata archaeon]|nr:valine--tRNA ligase [Euryarchaeota archaeon]MVT35270.1 valine--tRNA ligase [Euryarchaeota archaeon]
MNYDAKSVEKKWQEFWEKEGIYRFDFNSNREIYSIDNPPRYASGALHLGHATHYTHIDFIARYKRMRGYNVFFPLCFDVNGMPIEVNVEKLNNIKMREMERHKFIQLCEEFANSKIDTMKMQFKILGESMDPTIYYQTDSPEYRRITQLTFLDAVEKGMVYRGMHPVNWCPRCSTAIAESEIVYVNTQTDLYYIKFDVENKYVTIATTRPELIPACLFIAFNPRDERYKDLENRKARIPIFNREVPIIADESIDMEFGTGIEMVCSIGDRNDLKLIKKHGFEIIQSIDDQGRMTDIAGEFSGLYTLDARKEILKRLEEEKRLVKVEKIEHNVGTCWRCGTPLEIVNKEQWFIKTVELKDRILQIANELKWYPEFMKKRLEDWVNGLEWDWVVSRQRYFATPIPAWICPDGHVVYASKEDLLKRNSHVDPTVENPPVDKCPICGKPLKGVEEVFDTWVDSSISPLFNTYFYRDNNLFKKLYPMSLRPQAHDILRTWAFYSIIRCDIATGNKPWNDIFIDGHILAEDGRPMHASWGNVVDPLKIIEEFGTDPFRYFAATCTLGEDTPFRKRELVHGKKLLNKLWNVANFIEMNIKGKSEIYPEDSMDLWILSEFSETLENVTLFMDQYRYDRAIRELDEFFWHVFADHYIELIKYRVSKNLGTQYTLYNVFLGIIKMYAPFMPHITEEIYHRLFSKYEGEISIHLETWPEKYEKIFLDEGRIVKDIIASLRRYKNENNLRGINEVIIISPKLDITSAYDSIKGSLGISKLEIIKNASLKEIIVEAKPDLSKIGPLLKNSVSNFMEFFKNIPPERLLEGFEFKGIKIPKDYFEFKKIYTFKGKKVDVININDVTIIIK